LIFCICLFF
jgi:hypothetical protein